MNLKHGMRGTRIYRIWCGMIFRCKNPKSKDFPKYGGRGIKICNRWFDFRNFYEDMKEGYDDSLTIERIDVDGDYCKENCKWVTSKAQANNRRNNRTIEYGGNVYTLTQLAEKFSISKHLLHDRLKAGWSIEKALKEPKIIRGINV